MSPEEKARIEEEERKKREEIANSASPTIKVISNISMICTFLFKI